MIAFDKLYHINQEPWYTIIHHTHHICRHHSCASLTHLCIHTFINIIFLFSHIHFLWLFVTWTVNSTFNLLLNALQKYTADCVTVLITIQAYAKSSNKNKINRSFFFLMIIKLILWHTGSSAFCCKICNCNKCFQITITHCRPYHSISHNTSLTQDNPAIKRKI